VFRRLRDSELYKAIINLLCGNRTAYQGDRGQVDACVPPKQHTVYLDSIESTVVKFNEEAPLMYGSKYVEFYC